MGFKEVYKKLGDAGKSIGKTFSKTLVAIPTMYFGTRLAGNIASYFLDDPSIRDMGEFAATTLTGIYGMKKADGIKHEGLKGTVKVGLATLMGLDYAGNFINSENSSIIVDSLRNHYGHLRDFLNPLIGIENPETVGALEGLIAGAAAVFSNKKK